MNKSIKNAAQAGFTLIELIVVIVILGILAATALPKFANLSGDARAATVQAAAGSLNSVVAMTHGQALANSKAIDKTAGTVKLEEVTLPFDTATGYPRASDTLLAAAGLNTNDFHVKTDNIDPATATKSEIYPVAMETTDTNGVVVPATCKVTYTAAKLVGGVLTPPTVVAVVTGCN